MRQLPSLFPNIKSFRSFSSRSTFNPKPTDRSWISYSALVTPTSAPKLFWIWIYDVLLIFTLCSFVFLCVNVLCARHVTTFDSSFISVLQLYIYIFYFFPVQICDQVRFGPLYICLQMHVGWVCLQGFFFRKSDDVVNRATESVYEGGRSGSSGPIQDLCCFQVNIRGRSFLLEISNLTSLTSMPSLSPLWWIRCCERMRKWRMSVDLQLKEMENVCWCCARGFFTSD